MPLVSVIVPNYNHAPFLRQRLDSIYNQTFQDFEVIILDDCSTDNSKEIIEEYRNHPKTSHIVYNKDNSGSPFKQWAKGFDIAQGEYIWIAESDDWAKLDFLEKLYPVIEKDSSLSLVFSSSLIIQHNSKHPITAYSKSKKIDGKRFIKTKMILTNTIINASAVLFRKSKIETIPTDYQEYKGAGDCLFWIHLCESGNVFFLLEPLNFFRKHERSTTHGCLTDGIVFIESRKINRYLRTKKYISFDKQLILTALKIQMIKELKRSHSFSQEVDLKHLLKIWGADNILFYLKNKITWIIILLKKLFFLKKTRIAEDSLNEKISNLTLKYIAWTIIGWPY